MDRGPGHDTCGGPMSKNTGRPLDVPDALLLLSTGRLPELIAKNAGHEWGERLRDDRIAAFDSESESEHFLA